MMNREEAVNCGEGTPPQTYISDNAYKNHMVTFKVNSKDSLT